MVSTIIFHMIYFTHEGKIISIDQFCFCRRNRDAFPTPNVPLIKNFMMACNNVGVGMYHDFMGTLKIPPPIPYNDSIYMCAILLVIIESVTTKHSFITSYFKDPWVLPNPSILVEENGHARNYIPLSMSKIAYQSIQSSSPETDIFSSSWEEFNQFSSPM
jgi:hypothetical protein